MGLPVPGCRCIWQDCRLPVQSTTQRRLGQGIFDRPYVAKAAHPKPSRWTVASPLTGVRELRRQGRLLELTKLRSSKYLSKLIEQDCRNVKSRLGRCRASKLPFPSPRQFEVSDSYIAFAKSQVDVRDLATQGQTTREIWAAVLNRRFGFEFNASRVALGGRSAVLARRAFP